MMIISITSVGVKAGNNGRIVAEVLVVVVAVAASAVVNKVSVSRVLSDRYTQSHHVFMHVLFQNSIVIQHACTVVFVFVRV